MNQVLKNLTRRVGPGNILLKTCLLVGRPSSPQAQFDRIWNFGKRLGWLLSARGRMDNLFQAPWEHFLLIRTLKLVQADHPDYRPPVRVVGGDVLAEIADSEQGAIVATIHTAISGAIIYVLEQEEIRASLIGRYSPEELLGLLGAVWPCDTIYVDSHSRQSLIEARQKLKDGKCVVCCADDIDGNEKLMRTGIFEFATRMNSELVFSLVQVTQKGEIEVTFARTLDKQGARKSATDLASQFLRFLEATMATKSRWTLVRGIREKNEVQAAEIA